MLPELGSVTLTTNLLEAFTTEKFRLVAVFKTEAPVPDRCGQFHPGYTLLRRNRNTIDNLLGGLMFISGGLILALFPYPSGP